MPTFQKRSKKGRNPVAATGVMFIFSILFFGILTDAGTFRPIIGGITKFMGTAEWRWRR